MGSIRAEPIRRSNPGSYVRKHIPVVEKLALPPPDALQFSFLKTLLGRRSGEHFPVLDVQALSGFLYYTASIQQLNADDPNRQRRFVASMGALHPAYILLFRPHEGWFVYIPEEHALGMIVANQSAAASLLALVCEHFEIEQATVLCLISDVELAANYYKNFDALLLRDSGVLLGHASLVAAGYGLSFRILGRTGTPFSEALITGIPFTPFPTGLAIVGGRLASSVYCATV